MRIARGLCLAMLVAACAEDEVQQPIYDVADVQRRTIEVNVSTIGTVEPLATVEVKSKASGEVLELHVENGDLVEAGTLMVRIDPRIVRNRLAQSQAELKATQARRDIARTQMSRARRLLQQGTFTEADVEQATLDLANAEAQVVAAEVSVENARIAVDDTDLRAPITGTVIEKPVEKGQVISSPTQDFAGGTLLMKMADLSAVQIRALVDEHDVGKINTGMTASVSVAAYPNQPFPGEVVKIEPQSIDLMGVTVFAALISIRNPDGLLLPGMNAEVDISVARSEDVLSIPVMSLRTNRDIASTAGILGMSEDDIRSGLGAPAGDKGRRERPRRGKDESGSDYRFGGDFWVVVDSADGPAVRNVRTGITDLEHVEIASGLEADETVFILPSSNLVETQQQLQQWIKRRVRGVPGLGR